MRPGEAPDRVVAEALGVDRKVVIRARARRAIPACRRHGKTLEHERRLLTRLREAAPDRVELDQLRELIQRSDRQTVRILTGLADRFLVARSGAWWRAR